MADRYNSTTGLDETSEKVQAFFAVELETPDFIGLSLDMKVVDAWDRHPMFTITTPKGHYRGRIAEENVALLSDVDLRDMIRAHLVAARDGDF